MTDDGNQDRSPPEDVASGDGAQGASSFWIHATAWFLFYLTVVVAWGQRNSWPSSLLLCVLSVPMTLLVVSTLFKVHRFGTAIDPSRSQQEQLISALILAVGLASGQLLLMTLGLVFLGIAWLRPARPGIDWSEWLKVPVLFLTVLPFWLDLEGSRSPIARLFDHRLGNPEFRLPLALTTTQSHVLAYCGLLGMVLLLRGRVFWLSLPALPVFLMATCALPRWIPGYAAWPAPWRAAWPWILGGLLIAAASRHSRKLEVASASLVSGQTLKRWFGERLYPPWLAVLVVAVMQALPFETVRFNSGRVLSLIGTSLLLLLLLGLRARTPKGPIHSRSVAMVAGGLALTLLAEFATYENLRHVAVVFVLIGLVSWRCFWALRIFLISGTVALLLLLLPPDLALDHLDARTFLLGRMITALAFLIVLARWIQQPALEPGALGYGDEGWVPPKRFALILLGLMMLFQTAAAFWPDHELRVSLGEVRESPDTEPSDLLATGQTGWYRVPTAKGPVQITIAYPRKNPYLLESPERALRRHGWTVLKSERMPHPHGEAMGVVLERDGVRAAALWWFEVGQQAFANHLYARRVLWSGWHLADRRMRLVRLESTAVGDTHELLAIAEREQWIRKPGHLASVRP